MKKVDQETAEKDFSRFVECLKIKERKLDLFHEVDEDGKSPFEEIISLITYGILTIDKEGVATYTLEDPPEYSDGGEAVKSLIFRKRRLTVEELESRTGGKNDIEKARRLIGVLAKVNSATAKKFSTTDLANIAVISQFFL